MFLVFFPPASSYRPCIDSPCDAAITEVWPSSDTIGSDADGIISTRRGERERHHSLGFGCVGMYQSMISRAKGREQNVLEKSKGSCFETERVVA